MKRSVLVSNNAKNIVSFLTADIKKLIKFLDEFLPENLRAPQGELSIAFFDDDAIKQIHADFLDDPSPTDVITFDGEPEFMDAGEICISAQTAFCRAKEFSTTPSLELSLYIAHGYLHLAGVDDVSPKDAKKMRSAEKLAMQIIEKNFPKPIFKFKL